MYKKLTILIIGLFFLQKIFAQDSCQIAIVSATDAFAQGEYAKVVQLLEKRVHTCDYTTDTRMQALKMLAASYTELDMVEKAEDATYKFLHTTPIYQLQSTDPQAFASVFNKYSVKRRLSVGIDAGVQTPIVHVINSYNIWDAPDYSNKYKTSSTLTVNLFAQWYFTDRLAANAEVGFGSNNFTRQLRYGSMYKLDFTEKNVSFKFPWYLSFTVLSIKKFSLGLLAGAYYNSLINSNYTYTLSGSKIADKTGDGALHASRRTNMYGLLGGLYISSKKKRITYSIKGKYLHSLVNNNIGNQRYNSPEMILDLLHVDNDIKFSNIEATFGISYDIFFRIKHKYR